MILAAQPSLLLGVLSATEGATWQWTFVITDNSGAVVPFTTAGVTGSAKIYNSQQNGQEINPGTVTVATANDGSVTLNATAAATASVAAGSYGLSVKLTDGTKTINLCNAFDTNLRVVAY